MPVSLPAVCHDVILRNVSDRCRRARFTDTFTVEQGVDAVSQVIQHLETFDVTTIRAATPMYLMCRKIKAAGIKMVLSGEGADEVLGGYLYFHKAPNKEEHHLETVRKVKDLHYYDCLRANKATMAWGVEARVPFLDKGFLDYAMGLDPQHKLCGKLAPDQRIEKWALRAAFDTPDDPYLPTEVLWRQKEQCEYTNNPHSHRAYGRPDGPGEPPQLGFPGAILTECLRCSL